MFLLGQEEDKPTPNHNQKPINMKDAVYVAVKAWDCVKETTLKKAWNKHCPTETAPAPEELSNQFVSKLVGPINQSPGFEDCDHDNIHEWLKCDVDDPGYEMMTDNDIIAHVQETGDDDEEEDYDIDLVNGNGPSHDEAFHCLETAMLWLEQQEECDSTTARFSSKKTSVWTKAKILFWTF